MGACHLFPRSPRCSGNTLFPRRQSCCRGVATIVDRACPPVMRRGLVYRASSCSRFPAAAAAGRRARSCTGANYLPWLSWAERRRPPGTTCEREPVRRVTRPCSAAPAPSLPRCRARSAGRLSISARVTMPAQIGTDCSPVARGLLLGPAEIERASSPTSERSGNGPSRAAGRIRSAATLGQGQALFRRAVRRLPFRSSGEGGLTWTGGRAAVVARRHRCCRSRRRCGSGPYVMPKFSRKAHLRRAARLDHSATWTTTKHPDKPWAAGRSANVGSDHPRALATWFLSG